MAVTPRVAATATSGANIRYTVDGTNPTETYGTLISGSSGTASVSPAYYTHPTHLKAIAFKSGWSSSAVHVETYAIGDPSSDPCYPVAYLGCEDGGTNSTNMASTDSFPWIALLPARLRAIRQSPSTFMPATRSSRMRRLGTFTSRTASATRRT